MIVIFFLFNVLFRSTSCFRGVRRTAAYVKRKPGWLFSVSEAPDAVRRVHVELLTWPATGP